VERAAIEVSARADRLSKCARIQSPQPLDVAFRATLRVE
jgi:hypothetical protein